MPTALISFKVDPDSKVRVCHIFFAASKSAAEAELRQHAEACPKFGPAFRASETIEFAREIEEMPPSDGDELEEWLDGLLSGLEAGDEEEDEPIDMVPE